MVVVPGAKGSVARDGEVMPGRNPQKRQGRIITSLPGLPGEVKSGGYEFCRRQPKSPRPRRPEPRRRAEAGRGTGLILSNLPQSVVVLLFQIRADAKSVTFPSTVAKDSLPFATPRSSYQYQKVEKSPRLVSGIGAGRREGDPKSYQGNG